MKKIFVFNLYSNNQKITDNKLFEIHKNCIKYYKHVFDELIFYLNVDDLNDCELINDLIKWVSEVCEGLNFTIKVRKNTKLCEAETFRNEILNGRKKYEDCFVFFGHSKGSSLLDKDLNVNLERMNSNSNESLLKWCVGLYFYSFNFIDEIEKIFHGCPRASEMFYGPFLTQIKNPENNPILRMNKNNCHYQGTFYWINMNKFNNYIDRGIIDLPLIDDRFWVEMLPGTICGRNEWGSGCSSHNDVAINDDFNLYIMNNREWEYLLDVLGDKNSFYEFYNKIMSNIANI